MDKSISIQSINPYSFEYQDYSKSDNQLISNFLVDATFDPSSNYVNFFVYDLNGTLVGFLEQNYQGYSLRDQQLYVDPENDVLGTGVDEGDYNIVYYFLKNEVASSVNSLFYISQVSSNRTEIRLDTTSIPDLTLVSAAAAFNLQQTNTVGVYSDFYLNFGQGDLLIANNFQLDNSDPTNPTILIKLYEPLPTNFGIKDTCWIVTEVAEPVAFNVNIENNFQNSFVAPQISGPNFNLQVKDQINASTPYTSFESLTSQSYGIGSGSLQYQINSILAETGIEINVDYSDFNNFIYFSSAQTRLENFYYKLNLIETYQYSASITDGTGSGYISSSQNIWNEKINEIITTFDGYDYHLYYNSGSTSWPKLNSQTPYINAPTTNPGVGYNWFESQSAVALTFDEANNNALINAIPGYLREDSDNAEFELFIEMLGEMFDNIWIYYQDVTQKWNADNRLQYGVSKDLVADILRDLGIKIYQSNFSSADLYLAFLGLTPEGNQFPFPYITGSYPVPSGYEYIDTKISASSEVVPLEDIQKSFYKRLYHNLPYLLKKKGTKTGIQNLITTYGVPDTLLWINEFGGKDKIQTNDWDLWHHKYNYKWNTGALETLWTLNTDWNASNDRPKTLEFRFQAPNLASAIANPTQSLWSLDTDFDLTLYYTGSGYTSGSYDGSIPDPYNQYAELRLNAGGDTASLALPFFNGGWWSIATTFDGTDTFNLYAANNIYDGDDGSSIGFNASSSIASLSGGQEWDTGTISYFPGSSNPFSGSYQEIRYYTVALNQDSFFNYAMNPQSIEGNSVNGGASQLAFRAALGGELYTGSVSIHPQITGSWTATSSFATGSTFDFTDAGTYSSNTEYVFLRQPAAGIRNRIDNKIQIVDMNLPSGDTLSQYISVQQQNTSSLYTENSIYTEVAYSPQNEINDDINASLGFFNMGDYIGDPRQRFNRLDTYPDLDVLRNAYFEKYTHNYNIFEYINLIKYFDNSLFKMIKDFTPARSSLAAGVVIKQTLLERNKYPQPLVTSSLHDYTGSIDTAFIEGGPGGATPSLANGGITKVEILDGGFGYTGSASLYPITISGGGGGEGAVLTPIIYYQGTLPGTTDITQYITQNVTDSTLSGGPFIIGGVINGVTTDFFVSASGGTITFASTRNSFSPYTAYDLITFPSAVISSSTDLYLEVPNNTITAISGGVIGAVEINYPGKNYSSFPTLSITGTTGSDAILEVTELDNSIVTQTWSGYNVTPYGLAVFTQSSAEEFYTGEYSGSNYVVSDGELNSANSVKVVDTTLLQYESTGSQFNPNASPGQFFWTTASAGTGGVITVDGPAGVKYLYINETDYNGVNILQALQNLEAGDSIRFTIKYELSGSI